MAWPHAASITMSVIKKVNLENCFFFLHYNIVPMPETIGYGRFGSEYVKEKQEKVWIQENRMANIF